MPRIDMLLMNLIEKVDQAKRKYLIDEIIHKKLN